MEVKHPQTENLGFLGQILCAMFDALVETLCANEFVWAKIGLIRKCRIQD